MSTDNFSRDFLQGQIDCRDGNPHKAGMSEAYDRGFGTQYSLEAMLDAEFNRICNKTRANKVKRLINKKVEN